MRTVFTIGEMNFFKWWLRFAALSSACLIVTAAIIDEDGEVLKMVSRIKRHSTEEVHGHSLAVMHAENPYTGHIHRLNKRHVMAHAVHPSPAGRHFTLELMSGEMVHMNLSRRIVTIPGTKIVERLANNEEVNHQAPSGCFFAGPVKNAIGHATLSLCDGDMMGWVQADQRQYEIHSLPTEIAERQRRSTGSDSEHVLVTWTDVTDSHGLNFETLSVEEGGLKNDFLNIPRRKCANDGDGDDFEDDEDCEEDTDKGKRKRRSVVEEHELLKNPPKRSTAGRDPIIEVAAIMDKDFKKSLYDKYSVDSIDWVIRFILLKWSGVYSVYSDPKLGWDITIRLLHLEIWTENPSWYNSSYFNERMNLICGETQGLSVDQITIWTADSITSGRSGLAWVSGACFKTKRCSIQVSNNHRIGVELHELGHGIGMLHENMMTVCENSTYPRGFMDGVGVYAPPCYADDLETLIPRKGCFFREFHKPKDAQSIYELTPGQMMTLDEQCKHFYGDEYVYLPGDNVLCKQLVCLASDPEKISYGTLMQDYRGLVGTVCAPERTCVFDDCLPLFETSFVSTYVHNTIVDGGWGSWSPATECTTSYPSGASLTVSKRLCNNPEPQHGACCAGEAYKAEICTAEGVTTAPSVNVQDIANEICAYQRDHGPGFQSSSESYTGIGDLASETGAVGSCSVRCQFVDPLIITKTAYILPDGIPCVGPGQEVDDDFRGIHRLCVHGRCLAFGCDGKTLEEGGGLIKDACGVCGGSSETCTYEEFAEPFEEDERQTLVVLPVGATNIYIGLPLRGQENASVEIWTKDTENEQVVMSKEKNTAYSSISTEQSLDFANAFWYYNKDLQSLTASGPLNQPVTIMIHQAVQAKSCRAFYGYKLAPESSVAEAICLNGGTPLAGGCNCPKGYYGFTCEHTCPILCKNGATVDPAICKCVCDERQTGNTCECQPQYTGRDCSECILKCVNGGVLDSDKCECACPVNCDSLDCSEKCIDQKTDGWCVEWKCFRDGHKHNCRKMCGYCESDENINNGLCVQQ